MWWLGFVIRTFVWNDCIFSCCFRSGQCSSSNTVAGERLCSLSSIFVWSALYHLSTMYASWLHASRRISYFKIFIFYIFARRIPDKKLIPHTLLPRTVEYSEFKFPHRSYTIFILTHMIESTQEKCHTPNFATEKWIYRIIEASLIFIRHNDNRLRQSCRV